MTAFVDATVIAYAASEPDSELGKACKRIALAVGAGSLAAKTSTAAIEEVWHLELRGRPPGLEGVAADAYDLYRPLLSVTDEIVRDAFSLNVTRPGSNDRIHAATCRANGIDTILSTDSEFDELDWLKRVDPRDTRALAELLGKAVEDSE